MLAVSARILKHDFDSQNASDSGPNEHSWRTLLDFNGLHNGKDAAGKPIIIDQLSCLDQSQEQDERSLKPDRMDGSVLLVPVVALEYPSQQKMSSHLNKSLCLLMHRLC